MIKAVDQKPIAEVDDQIPLVMVDVRRKAIGQIKEAAQSLLTGRISADEAAELAHTLAPGTWTHDYPITASEAKALGLPVKTDIPNKVLEDDTLSAASAVAGWRRGISAYSASEAA